MESGTRLGPYEILEQLGAGGMGEVWLAEDSRLGRKVAIKVLPPEFATEPERVARFEQEARAAAALNHPHIAAVFDIGEHDAGVRYIVQEYLEGRSLGEVLRETPPKLEHALTIGSHVADALATAHAAGIVHRDIKPDNIFITDSGHTKVLDFGLAKLVSAGALASGDNATESPTGMGTMAGAMMGTIGYMAPEQVEGGAIDGRTDIFALGCVLYEMIGGQRPFQGENMHRTLVRVVSEDPAPLGNLRPGIPDRLRWIVGKCLAKDPGRRHQTAGDLCVDLRQLVEDIAAGTVGIGTRPEPGGPARSSRRLRRWAAAAVGAVVFGLGALTAVMSTGESAAARRPTWVAVDVPPEILLPPSTGPLLALSPDGRTLVFVGDDGVRRLHARSLDSPAVRQISGTEGASDPFFSPDGMEIGFRVGDSLRRATLDGAVVTTLCDDCPGDAAWGDDGDIYLLRGGNEVWRLTPASGSLEKLVDVVGALRALMHPEVLPGSRWILVSFREDLTLGATAAVGAVSVETGQLTRLVDDAVDPLYSGTGHIIAGRANGLVAVPFDPIGMLVTGPARSVLDSVRVEGTLDVQAVVSANGTLAYVAGESLAGQLTWVDRDGTAAPVTDRSATYVSPRLSPDGTRIATASDDKLWIYDIEADTMQLLSQGEGLAQGLAWSHDGGRIVFSLLPEGATDIRSPSRDLFSIPTDFSGPGTAILDHEFAANAPSLGPTGDLAFYDMRRTETSTSAFEGYERNVLVRIAESEETVEIAVTRANERAPEISPDGRWIAYVSDESGADEVYVEPLPTGGRRVQVSNAGGLAPFWNPAANEIFYVTPELELVARSFSADPVFAVVGAPQGLFSVDRYVTEYSSFFRQYDVTPDGTRFLLVRTAAELTGAEGRIHVVLNWSQDLVEQ